jgi:PGF-CTERM protein
VNNLAGPDNIAVLDDGRVLIGEDTGKHESNMVWLWQPTGDPEIGAGEGGEGIPEVGGNSGTGEGGDDGDATSIPGFGLILSIIAALGAALIATRR